MSEVSQKKAGKGLVAKRLALLLGTILTALWVAEAGLRIECYLRRHELRDTEVYNPGREPLAVPADTPGLVYTFRSGALYESDGRSVSVIRRCTQETPTLRPLGDDATHCHACLLR